MFGDFLCINFGFVVCLGIFFGIHFVLGCVWGILLRQLRFWDVFGDFLWRHFGSGMYLGIFVASTLVL